MSTLLSFYIYSQIQYLKIDLKLTYTFCRLKPFEKITIDLE